MKRLPTCLAVALTIAVTATACAGAHPTSTTTLRTHVSRAALLAAVRSTVFAHHRLSVRALWTNTISAHQTIVAGPALSDLRSSVADRRKRRVRVRLISERFRIASITLESSYTRAFVRVTDPQRVRPYGYDGKPLGKSVALNERATLELRRIGRTTRFVVWKVT